MHLLSLVFVLTMNTQNTSTQELASNKGTQVHLCCLCYSSMIYVLDNINSDLNGIFTMNELKLFLILYADDQALSALSPESLQLM